MVKNQFPTQYVYQQIPEYIGDYKVIEEIGKGGFGVVYKVEKDFKLYALKKLTLSNMKLDEITAALEEIQILRRMNYINVVKYVDSFHIADGQLQVICIVMEYCERGSLQDMINRQDPRIANTDYIINIMMNVCLGVVYIHRNGVMHRDIKPANMFIHSSGYLKIGDFGSSKYIGYNQLAKTICGTPHYMAPEVRCGLFYDNKSDMWSVGALLFDLVNCRYLQLTAYSGIQPLMNQQMSQLCQLHSMLKNVIPSQRPSAAETYAMLFSIKYPPEPMPMIPPPEPMPVIPAY